MSSAALACLLPAAQASRLPKAAASFAPLPAHSAGWRRAAAVSVAAPRRRRWAPGVAYAAAATEKSIYDFTVKVTASRLCK
jgi:glutathione peroxidase